MSNIFSTRAGVAVIAAALAGCQTAQNLEQSAVSEIAGSGTATTATDRTRLTQSGFLSDYARLRPTAWGQGIECWRAPGVNARKYGQAMFSRIVVMLKPGKAEAIDPSDLKMLTDYFYQQLARNLGQEMPVVNHAGPGVLVIRIALTQLVPTTVVDSLAGTLVPYAFIAEASSGVATGRPAGSTPYLGETAIEMQFRDGGTGAILGECRDTEIGRKYAADLDKSAQNAAQTWVSGYLNSFTAWSYAKDAFDKWALLTAQRISALRGGAPTAQ